MSIDILFPTNENEENIKKKKKKKKKKNKSSELTFDENVQLLIYILISSNIFFI